MSVEHHLTKPEWNGWEDYSDGKVKVTVGQWRECLENPNVFTDANIDFVLGILQEPYEAFTCKGLSEEEDKHSSSYNWTVVHLSERITNELNLPKLQRRNGMPIWWPVVFLGKRLDDGHFSWKVRPELAEALRQARNTLGNRKSPSEYQRDKEQKDKQRELENKKSYKENLIKENEKIVNLLDTMIEPAIGGIVMRKSRRVGVAAYRSYEVGTIVGVHNGKLKLSFEGCENEYPLSCQLFYQILSSEDEKVKKCMADCKELLEEKDKKKSEISSLEQVITRLENDLKKYK